MKHARKDYNRIQDPAEIIPEEEPVFLIRAQDVTSSVVVRFWAQIAEQVGADPEIVRLAREQADRMESWIPRKVPDIP